MGESDHAEYLALRVRVMRIIVLGLVLGAAIFVPIAVSFQAGGNGLPPPETPILTYMALVYGVATLGAFLLIPNLLTNANRRKLARGMPPKSLPGTTDMERLIGLYQVRLIIGAACLEGAAYFFLIAYLIEGNYLALGAGIVFIGLIALQFPSQLGLERWLERQQELIAQERLGNP